MHCDILVIGAGPGGSTAAYWAARFGADVILVDKAHFPRNKPCGDGLIPDLGEMLQNMGMGEFLHTRGRAFKRVRLFAPDGEVSEINLSQETGELQSGWVIPRRVMDAALVQNAVSAGARFQAGFAAQEPLYDGERLIGVSGTLDGNPVRIEAPQMIVATGANRRLLERLGLSGGEPPSALAVRLYMTGLPDLDDSLQFYLDPEVLPGYGWVFPTAEKSANIGCGVILNQMSTSDGSRLLRSCLGRLVGSMQRKGGTIQSPAQGYPLRTDFPGIPILADGVLVVGETAGLVDPITCEGITEAVRSGWLAAKVATQALEAGDFSARQLSLYREILNAWYGSYFTGARQLVAWLGEPGVVDAILACWKSEPQITRGLKTAVLEKQPEEGLNLLKEALGSGGAAIQR